MGTQARIRKRIAFFGAPFFEGGHGGGEQIVPGHGIDEAAGGGHIAHQAGDDARGGSHAHDRDAGFPHGCGDRVEGGQSLYAVEAFHPPEILHPASESFRLRSGGDQGQGNVGEGRGDQGDHQDPEGFLDGKAEFLRGMGHGLKARIGPRCQEHDEQDPRAGLVIRREQGLHGAGAGLSSGKHGEEGDEDAHDKEQGQQDLGHGSCPAAFEAHKTENQHRQEGDHDLAEINVIARDGIEIAEVEQITQDIAENKGDGGGIGPDDGQVHQPHEPGGEEAVVITEDRLGEGEGAARIGITVHQIGIVDADDEHDQGADGNAQRRPQRSGDGKEGGSRHDKGAPADAAAEGKRPDRQRGQAADKARRA